MIIREKILKEETLNPIINTSMRTHSKWGDFLVAIIPITWCGNILINSNFILRMIEWQNESSLFTIRIQGKQWYWSYKYSNDINYRLNNVYINVGNNNWFKITNPSKHYANYQNSTLSFIFEHEFKTLYKNNIKVGEKSKLNSVFLNYNTEILKNKFFNNKVNIDQTFLKHNNITKIKNIYTNFNLKNKIKYFNNINIINNIDSTKSKILYNFFSNKKKEESGEFTQKLYINFYNKFFQNSKNINIFNFNSDNLSYFDYDSFNNEEVGETTLKVKTSNFPIKLIKGILNKHNITNLNKNSNLKKNILFNFRINKIGIDEKISHVEQFWGFRQKKYKKLRSFNFPSNNKYSNKTYNYIGNYVNNENFNKYYLYNGVQTNKYKNEMIPVTLARRLLRTKRTLILPAHINLTLITSSYDVIHSWFVPGLGLKVDCVPGRSTHHTLYIDNVGFYYGQCAEICGRYHHHMPIRLCAIPFEHFLLWWQTRGLPRMYRSKTFIEKKTNMLKKIN